MHHRNRCSPLYWNLGAPGTRWVAWWQRSVSTLLLPGVLVAGVLAAPLQASEMILFNESPAHRCYQAALERRDRIFGLEDCDTAIEKQGLTTDAMAATLSNRGLLLARSGAMEAALKDHDRAVRLAPELGSLFINRANAHTLSEQFLPALQDLDHAVALGGEQVHLAYYNRALIHQRLGNLEAARSDAEKALAAVPVSDRYASLLNSLRDRPMMQQGAEAEVEEAEKTKEREKIEKGEGR